MLFAPLADGVAVVTFASEGMPPRAQQRCDDDLNPASGMVRHMMIMMMLMRMMMMTMIMLMLVVTTEYR